jgi:hypothetical protein
MEPLNRTHMADQYKGQWVALKADRETVIAAGPTLRQALDAAQEKGVERPILTRMPKKIRSFIGFHRDP